jgi:large subunit ribosomal protein L31
VIGSRVAHSGTIAPWSRFTPFALRDGDPAARKETMKKDIHPDYRVTEVTCACGATFTTRSTAANGVIHSDVCSQCHPFYTGKQKILDTGGRVARFEARYAKTQKKTEEKADEKADAASSK